MALRITKSTDAIPVDQIVATIYAPPGVGKTTIGFTAASPLLLDFDSGAYRAGNRGDSVAVKAWADVATMTKADLDGYSTVVVDTAGRALDILASDIIARNPKMGRAGALTLQGYGQLKAEFTAWLKMLRSFGLDVILLAHADEQRNGDEVIERIDAQGGSKNEIYKSSDAMGRLAIREGKRVLLFSPSDTAFGKNPAQLPPLDVPHCATAPQFLAGVIQTIKQSLNSLSAEQAETAALLAAWREKVEAATTAKAMTDLIAAIDTLDERIRQTAKQVLWSHAKSTNHTYDKDRSAFVEAAA